MKDVSRRRAGCAQHALIFPGTGSDEVFVTEVFAAPLAAVGVRLVAAAGATAGDFFAALDEATVHGPVLAGGISAGAHAAAEWAVANPERCAGLLLALPGWTGEPDAAPARLAARLAADAVRRDGLDAALRAATAGVPGWLAAELDRAWRRHGAGLLDTMTAAADRPSPDAAELAKVRVPAGVAGCRDDPVHPASVAREWAGALPCGAAVFLTMAQFGADRAALGRAAVLAWLRAGGRPG